MTSTVSHIEVLITRITHAFSDDVYQYYYENLTPELRDKNRNFVRWQDRHANLMGKILLLSSSLRLGTGANALLDLKYNDYGKPFLDYLRFSISHSGEFVVCASTTSDIDLGIDIEWKKPVQFSDLSNTMDSAQWEQINQEPGAALDRFYSYWVIKESVIKAEGRGLSFPLTDIVISNNIASVKGDTRQWHIKELFPDPGYAMAIAASEEICGKSVTMSEFAIGSKL